MKRFMAGFAILCKYEPDGEISADHDEVYCSGPTADKMTEEERQILDSNGWTWSERYDAWRKVI